MSSPRTLPENWNGCRHPVPNTTQIASILYPIGRPVKRGRMLDIGCWLGVPRPYVGCWILDVGWGCASRGVGPGPYVGCWILDVGWGAHREVLRHTTGEVKSDFRRLVM